MHTRANAINRFALLVLTIAVAAYAVPVAAQGAGGSPQSIIVVDGDTVKLDGRTYRLLDFDTPETFFAKCPRERELGEAATERLRQLVETTDARLEPTGRHCGWGRPCARLFFDGEDAADIMIREGHAVPYKRRQRRPNWCEQLH